MTPDMRALVSGAGHDDLARTVMALAAMHEPDDRGHCPHCQPERRWRRRPPGPCETWRVLVAQLSTLGPPSWRSA